MKTDFPGNLRTPAAARHYVTHTLHRLGVTSGRPRADDVVLVVSELVTNSVRAGANLIEVEVDVAGDRVQVRVSDDAPGWPSVEHPDWDALSGRGLAIVEDVADGWRVTPLRQGKQVTVTWTR